jgi:hypothetical protein
MSDPHPTIICGFPGIGKSYAAKKRGWHDSDSSQFSWVSYGDVPRVRDPEFPANYIAHIARLEGTVLVSSHSVVRNALVQADLSFSVCYPERQCLSEYLERYRQRGSPESFVILLASNWDNWLGEMENETRATSHLVLRPGQYLDDVLPVA